MRPQPHCNCYYYYYYYYYYYNDSVDNAVSLLLCVAVVEGLLPGASVELPSPTKKLISSLFALSWIYISSRGEGMWVSAHDAWLPSFHLKCSAGPRQESCRKLLLADVDYETGCVSVTAQMKTSRIYGA